jgi:sulfite reductase (ferredoxin)
MVGGGMGRTHNKETTFARAADHLGYVDKSDITEALKSILAAQRDHGNREVHTLGAYGRIHSSSRPHILMP